MNKLSLSYLGTTKESVICSQTAALLIIPLIISGFLWKDKQIILWSVGIVLFIIYLILLLTTPLWAKSAESAESAEFVEPVQMYRIITTKTELYDIVNSIKNSNGTEIKIYSYDISTPNTVVQFSARGLRSMSTVTFVKPLEYTIPTISIKNGYLEVFDSMTFGMPIVDHKVYVYYLNGISSKYVDALKDEFFGVSPPTIGQPKFINDKFEDANMVMVTDIPKDTMGLNFRVNKLSGYGFGVLEIQINNKWYNLYNDTVNPYYTQVNVKNGIPSIVDLFEPILNANYDCICPNYNGDNMYQITPDPTLVPPPVSGVSGEFTWGTLKYENCKINPMLNSTFARKNTEMLTGLTIIPIPKEIAAKICPTYYQMCSNDSECNYNDTGFTCDNENKCTRTDCVGDECDLYIEMDRVDWGEDPDNIEGNTNLEKLLNCINYKSKQKINNMNDCDFLKQYTEKCSLKLPTTEEKTEDKIAGALLVKYVEAACVQSVIGLGIKTNLMEFIQKIIGVGNTLTQIKNQCCNS